MYASHVGARGIRVFNCIKRPRASQKSRPHWCSTTELRERRAPGGIRTHDLPVSSRMCVCFSRQGAGYRPQLAVDRLRAHDQVAAGAAVHDVGLESLQPYLKVPRQALLDLDITHPRSQLQLLLALIVRTAFKANVNHGLTSVSI